MTDLSQIQFQRDALRSQKQLEEWAIAIFTASSVALTFAPVFFRDAPKWTRTLFHTAGATAGALATYAAMTAEKRQKLYTTLENIELDALRSQFQNTAATISIANTLQGQVAAVNAIAAQPLPPMARLQLARQQGLGELFVSMYGEFLPQAPQPVTVEAVASPASAQPIAPAQATPLGFVPTEQEMERTYNPAPPFRDLSVEIADYSGHIAYVSKTQSGKTSSMLRSIQRSIETGKAVMIIDGKGDARLRAVEGVDYVHCNDKKKIPTLFATLDKVLEELTARQDGTKPCEPAIDIYIDEYNLILAAAARYGKWEESDGVQIKGDDKWAEDCERIVLQGAAANIRIRASNHTSRVEDWKWNSGVLDSVSFVALGRLGAYESIEDLIKYQISERLKPGFKDDLERYRKMSFGEAPLLLTTLAPVGYCVLPQVNDGQAQTVSNQTVSFKTEPTQTNNGGGTGINWLDNLEAQLPEKPTVDQVKTAYEALTGKALDEGQLPYLLKLLQDRSWEIS